MQPKGVIKGQETQNIIVIQNISIIRAYCSPTESDKKKKVLRKCSNFPIFLWFKPCRIMRNQKAVEIKKVFLENASHILESI